VSEEQDTVELLAQDHDLRCPLLVFAPSVLLKAHSSIIADLCTCRDESGHRRRPSEDELEFDGEDEHDLVDDDAADERADDDERWLDRMWEG
jgi:hypothetical protein